MNFYRTIRFKLTAWYAALLLLLCMLFLGTINTVITLHYEEAPQTSLEYIIENTANPTLRDRRGQLLEQLREEQELQDFVVGELRKQDMLRIRRFSWFSLFPLAVLSIFGGYLIAGSMLRPIHRVIDATKNMTPKKLKHQIPIEENGDEISDLIHNFNRMTARLDRAFESQTQFIENASHELKTPLTIISTNLEAAIRAKKNTEQAKKYITQAQHAIMELNRLLDDLLLLSLAEHHVQTETVVVQQLIEDITKDATKIGISEHKTVQQQGETLVGKVRGNATLLKRALMNVVENAIKFSQASTTIVLTTAENAETITIRVCDTGPGIPRNIQEKIFERFYQGETSRKQEGAGIGLSISKQLIELHGGTIAVEESNEKGTAMRIQLPRTRT